MARWLMYSVLKPLDRRQYAALWAFDSSLGRGFVVVVALSAFASGVLAALSQNRASFVAYLIGALQSVILLIFVFRLARAESAKPIHPASLRRFAVMLKRLFFPPLPGASRERRLFLLAAVGFATGMTIWIGTFFFA